MGSFLSVTISRKEGVWNKNGSLAIALHFSGEDNGGCDVDADAGDAVDVDDNGNADGAGADGDANHDGGDSMSQG